MAVLVALARDDLQRARRHARAAAGCGRGTRARRGCRGRGRLERLRRTPRARGFAVGRTRAPEQRRAVGQRVAPELSVAVTLVEGALRHEARERLVAGDME